MGEQKRLVVEHYPVDKLPEELRQGLETGRRRDASVRIAPVSTVAPFDGTV